MKKLMCAALNFIESDCFKLEEKIVCDLWPPNITEPNEPYDWREAARSAASYERVVLKESDLIDVKAYIAFKIRTSVFFRDKTILSNIKLDSKLSEVDAVIVASDGYPLLVCWEEDWI